MPCGASDVRYRTREEVRQDIFDYIEMFYNPKCKHAQNGKLSPIDYERQQKSKHQGVWEMRGYSGHDKTKALPTSSKIGAAEGATVR